MPLVSVVIPTYNEEKDIGECISSLLKQSYGNMEIIIVDDGSKDRTVEIVKGFRKVKLIKGEHRGPGFSRNKGAKIAKGKILVFVDADMTFDKNYVKNLTLSIREGKTIGTEEKYQVASNLDNVWSRCWGAYSKKNSQNRGFIFRAILRDEFLKRGGFDPKYGYADDMTLYFKYGLRSEIAEKAFCYHKNPESLKEVYKQSRWIGASLKNQAEFLSIPIINVIGALVLVPASLVFIPFMSLKKKFSQKKSPGLHYYLVFYSVRYYGTLVGIFREIFMKRNVR